MITLDVHSVRKISARSNTSECGKYSWLTLEMDGPRDHVALTLFMPDPTTAEIYASAIRSVKIEPVAQQEAA